MTTDLASRQLEFATVSESESSDRNLLGFAWRRKWIIIFVIGVSLGLGYLLYRQQPRVYQSAAQALFIKRRASLPGEEFEPTTLGTAHESLMRSPRIIKRALKGNLAKLHYEDEETGTTATGAESLDETADAVVEPIDSPAELDDEDDQTGATATSEESPITDTADPVLRPIDSTVGEVLSGLQVTGAVTESGDIVRLTYKSTDKDECAAILNALLASYAEFLGKTYKSDSEDALELFDKAKTDLISQLELAQEEYQEFQEKSYREYGEEATLLFSEKSSENVYDTRLREIERTRAEAELEIGKIEAKIAWIDESMKNDVQRKALILALGEMLETKDGESHSANEGEQPLDGAGNSQVLDLLIEEQMLLERFGPEHPQVQTVRKRIELVRKNLPQKKPIVLEQPQADSLEIYRESLQAQIQLNLATIEAMKNSWDGLSDKAKRLRKLQTQNERFRSQIDTKKRLFDNVLRRLEEINLMQDASGTRMALLREPTNAVQVEPDLRRLLIVAGFLGSLVGIGLAFLVDRADRRFRSPDDVRNDLGLPVVGHIPVIAAERKLLRRKGRKGAGISPMLCVHHNPQGRISEAYRAIRTAIYFSTRGRGHQVIQVTSPTPGDGKTTLAANLAISIASSGKKTLLLDADFRRPRVHTLFAMENFAGISEIVEGHAELDDVIQETGVTNLSVLPCGPPPDNPSELTTSRGFEELLDVLREKFELVIVDSPPVLAVTDPLNVAPRVDGLLLVLRLTKAARQNTHRALESLDAVGANVLGVVVNGVGSGPYSRNGYSSSGYRHGSGYGKGYGGYRAGYGQSEVYGRGNGNGNGNGSTNGDRSTTTMSGMNGTS